MLTPDEITARLRDADITAVAYHTGLHPNTVRNYRAGKVTEPTYAVIRKLSEYLSGDGRSEPVEDA